MRLLLVLALTLATPAAAKPGAGEAGRLLALGDSLLEAGDFAGAEAAYTTAESWGWTSAALAHNRGLGALRGGNVGAALGHLHRARRMAPGDASIAQSLAAARAAAGLRAAPESPAWRVVRVVARPAGVSGLIVIASALGLVAVALMRQRRCLAAYAAAGAALVAWSMAASAWIDAGPRGVVMAPTSLRAAPAHAAGTGMALDAGRMVRLGPAHGAWRRAAVPGGPEGWVRSEMLENG